MTRCPLCGSPSGPSGSGWDKRDYRAFGLGDIAALPAGIEYEHRRPVRDPAIESDVITPVLQSVMSGAVGAILSGAGAVIADASKPVAFAALGGAGVLGLAWFTLLREHRGLLWEVERITGADIDGDGEAGPPQGGRDSVPIEVIERGSSGDLRRIRYGSIELPDDRLEQVARALFVERASFSRRGLSGVLTQSQYSGFYDSMIESGLLVHTSNSNELTAAGRSFLRQYL